MQYLSVREVGDLARELRENAGLSQRDVAHLVGSSQPNVSAAECGKSTRYVDVAMRIIALLSNQQIAGPFFVVCENSEGDK